MKKYKSRGKAVEVTANSKEENFEDFCLDFVQEFGLRRRERVWRVRILEVLERERLGREGVKGSFFVYVGRAGAPSFDFPRHYGT